MIIPEFPEWLGKEVMNFTLWFLFLLVIIVIVGIILRLIIDMVERWYK